MNNQLEFEREICMKKYEYKFVEHENKLGFNYEKKVLELEKTWNELGEQGWKFCKDGNGFTIFMREVIK